MAEFSEVKTTPVDSVVLDEGNLKKSPCKICLQVQAKYTCPRCNINYCSLTCYQSEKHCSCSEAFYKECVIDELKDFTSTTEDREKVLEMLAKDLEERTKEASAEDSDEDLTERLEGLDLDRDVSTVWSRLTAKEKEEFARMLQDGRLARLIEVWTPWWLIKANQTLVKEEREKRKEQNSSSGVPEIMSDIPDISNILKNSKPSANCRFDVLNLLTAYAFVTRLHNGCHNECPVDSTQDLMDTCFVLQGSCSCGSVGEAVQAAVDAIVKKTKDSEKSSNKFNIDLLKDVKVLISGPGKNNNTSFMSAALSDVIGILLNAQSVIKKELRDKIREGCEDVGNLKSQKSSLFKAERKVSFLLSWLQRYGMALHQLEPLLQFEIETRESEVEDVEEIKSAVEKNLDKLRPAITEDKTSKENSSGNLQAKLIVELD
ncbi:zinc finger HIT domain-containing protein 2 [Aplysia californica]|uniref:Zinc finger HIT domain-containing protein 2 n=1 Tax=Aplysia californica TaxID=6500 RepID=A0ABM0JVC1_APLCA|nr:zinc finger HIT domain-containing protein 2 [Aplysia californica]